MTDISDEYKNQIEILHSQNKMGKNSKRKIPKLFNMPEFLEKYKPKMSQEERDEKMKKFFKKTLFYLFF